MFSAIFASHQPYIATPVSPPPAPPAPPAPTPAIQPPVSEPIAFSAVTRASLFGVTGSAISSTTLATVACADASMTIRQSSTVAGLTLAYAGGLLTVSGTPTAPTGVHRVVVSYIASDGSAAVRGSTEHEITIVAAAEVLTIGAMAGAVGRVGKALSVTLASPSSNYAADVTAAANSLVPGCEATLAWTKGASTGSGTLTLTGTPTDAGTYALSVTFRSGDVVLGSSAHAVVIDAAYSAASSAPAPAPAPTPPSPSPPPVPSPAPAPGRGPDPYLAQTKVLLYFNSLATSSYDPAVGPAIAGKNDAVPSQNYFSTQWLSQQVNPGLGYKAEIGRSGAAATGAYTAEGGRRCKMTATIGTGAGGSVGPDGSDGALTVECLADIESGAWSDLTEAGNGPRLCPLVTLVTTGGELVWLLGLASWILSDGTRRAVYPVFLAGLTANSAENAALTTAISAGAEIAARPDRFVHLAGGRKASGSAFQQAAWFDGQAGAAMSTDMLAKLRTATSGTASISGQPPPITLPQGLVTWVPFRGGLDEVRVTAASRYSAYIATTPTAIPLASRVTPWPNY